MHLNLALQAIHRIPLPLEKKQLFTDTRFLSQCYYLVKYFLWRVRGKSDADMLTEKNIYTYLTTQEGF